MKKIVIIDYQVGNLFSVKQACEKIGLNPIVSSDRDDIFSADALILPGVGAFSEAMKNLKELDLIDPIRNSIYIGKPYFGICLGLQLLFSKSEEFGETSGLNIIKGDVKKFPILSINNDKIKVPQIGWNKIYKNEINWEETPLKNIQENDYMYFVHSFYVVPNNTRQILTKTTYNDIEYCSSVFYDNIFATQFHPEKSGEFGVDIYNNWANLYNLK